MTSAKHIKVILLGDPTVGKTSMIQRYINNTFQAMTEKTTVIDSGHTTVSGVPVEVWDTAGQEQHHCLNTVYYRGAQGIVFVYDVTRRETFDDLEAVWMREVEQNRCILAASSSRSTSKQAYRRWRYGISIDR